MKKVKEIKIGLYSCGNAPYWAQFSGLKERLEGYGRFIESKIKSECGVTVCNFGMVDSYEKGAEAGEYFNREGVSLIFCHVATYSPSVNVLPVHKKCGVKTILLNLQPCVRVNYEKTDTGEWLAHCNACAVPEICNALDRCGIDYEIVNGLLGQTSTPDISLTEENTADRKEAVRAWAEISEWVKAAKTVGTLDGCKFGFLGNYYNGMLDMYSDLTVLSDAFSIEIAILEMCDVKHEYDGVTSEEIEKTTDKIKSIFDTSGRRSYAAEISEPTDADIEKAAKVACAQFRLVEEFNLDALAYYYHGRDGGEYETLQSGFITGCSLLTAEGVPCAGEADIKTAIAMKICDVAGVGGSFCEIVTTDYDKGTIIVGHDGPFHIAISDGKPQLRGMSVYHGKRGSGVSVETKVISGEVTTLGVRQTCDGKVRMIISRGVATDDEIMRIGNTQTHVKFSLDPDAYMDEWFKAAPTHHFALSVGDNVGLFVKIAKLLKIGYDIIG